MTEAKEFSVTLTQGFIRNKIVDGRDLLPYSSNLRNLRNLRFQIRNSGRFPRKRNKPNGAKHPFSNCPRALFDEQQILIGRISDGNHHPPAVSQLTNQRLRDVIRRSGYNYCVKWRELRPAFIAITTFQEDISVSHTLEIGGRSMIQLIDNLDREHLSHQFR